MTVSATKVLELVTSSISAAVVTSNMLPTAENIVTVHLTGKGHSDTTLDDITLYLAAHFVALVEEGGAVTMRGLGEARDGFADVFSAGLGSTRFGQTALALDTTGTLTRLTAPSLKAEFKVV